MVVWRIAIFVGQSPAVCWGALAEFFTMIQPIFRNHTAQDRAAASQLGSKTGRKGEGFDGPRNSDPQTLSQFRHGSVVVESFSRTAICRSRLKHIFYFIFLS
jgi:hypothetical protein